MRAKYEGFLIADTDIEIGGATLPVGAYGFGFSDDNKLNIFDVSGREVLFVGTQTDRNMRRPRPLSMHFAQQGFSVLL